MNPHHFNANYILDTIEMVEKYRLDIRTVTMGINLLGCQSPEDVYQRCTSNAAKLVAVCDGIERELGIPIVNKRIAVTPVALLAAPNPVAIAHALNRAAIAVGIDFIGGYSALVEKGATKADLALLHSIPEALSTTDVVCASVNVASSKSGINMDAVKLMGEIIQDCAQATKDTHAIACAKLVVFANAVGDNPFMAGAFHGIAEPDCVINVGISGPGVIDRALRGLGDADLTAVAEEIKKAAFKITRTGQLVGELASQRLGVPFGIVDLSLAPTAEVGDSVAAILEHMGLDHVGAHGTTAALALLNDAVKKGGMMACSKVGGLSGSFIPVSEDHRMIEAVRIGTLSIDKLEAMTSICSVGLDMIALPGDTSAAIISGMIADEAAIGVMNHKTTAVRVIPVPGADIGDEVDFGGLLGYAPVIPVHQVTNSGFINRGGNIPAPIHGFRN